MALPLIATFPVLVFAIATTIYLTQEQQHSLEREIVHVARQSLQATDSLLRERLSTLDRLSAIAAEENWERLADQSRHVLSSRPYWLSVTIEDVDGSLLFSEASAGAPALPSIDDVSLPPDAEQVAVVVADGEQPPFLLLRTGGGTESEEFVISAALDLAPFSESVQHQADPSWTVAVLDSNNAIAGRSRARTEYVGARATRSLVDQIEAATESFFYSLTQEGHRVYTAFSTSPQTGWTAAVGAPAQLVEGPLRRAQLAWMAGGLAAVAIAALLGWLLTRNILERQAAERRAMQLEADRQSEARLTEIAAHFPGLIYRRVQQPDGTVIYPYLSSATSRLLGEGDEHRPIALPDLNQLAAEHVVPEDRSLVHEAIRRSAETLEPYQVEVRFSRPDGSHGWMRSMASTRRAADGSVIWDGVTLDVTELKEAENALKAQTDVLRTVNQVSVQIASELDRDKLVQLVLDAGREVVRGEFGAFFYNVTNDSGESYMLYALSGAKQEDFAGFPMPRNTAIFGPTFRGEGMVRLDDVTTDPRYGRNRPYRGMPEGHLPVRSYLAAPVVSRTGEVLGGLFFGHPDPNVFDAPAEQALSGIAAQAAVALENAHLFKAAEDEIAQRKKIESQQRMLLAELNHRVKNTLAVVLSIAQQTARGSGSLEHFTEVYLGRIMALANAHTLLTEGNWQSATLKALVVTSLEPYADVQGGDSVVVSGPDVTVPPKQALALSLVLHELATNASKYGGLATAGGRVHVTWAPDKPSTLRLLWREQSAVAVDGPEREGFGSRLIRLNVERELGGVVHRVFARDGFCAEIRLPWNSATGEIATREEYDQGQKAE